MKRDRGPLSWPLCHCAFLSSFPDLSEDLGKPQQSSLNSVTLSLPFIRGLLSEKRSFNNQHSTEQLLFIHELLQFNDLYAVVAGKVAENAASRHLSHKESQSAYESEWKREDIWWMFFSELWESRVCGDRGTATVTSELIKATSGGIF